MKIPHLKSILFVLFLVVCGVFALFGSSWGAEFKSGFVYVLFCILQAAGIIGFIGGIYWYSQTNQQD
jgi:hypothetical protein